MQIGQRLDFDGLDATEFEEFCFQLLDELPEFTNVDWRKGTGLAGSPADSGRDIVAQVEHVDPDGARHTETWFVDCKHYKKGFRRRQSKECSRGQTQSAQTSL